MSVGNPTVSVIMPCYNQGQYLEEAVGSLLAQTNQDFEIIVINDGSTDDFTVRLLQTYEQPNLTVLNTANRGPSAARNRGIQQARGKYILPLDADDRIAPTFLAKTVPILDENPNVGIVYTQAELFGEKLGRFDLPSYRFPDILLGNMIFNTSLYRKADWEKAGGYNENMVWGWEDYDFWLSLLELGREVIQLPEVLYFHREVPQSRSQQITQEAWLKCQTQIFKNHTALYLDHLDVMFRQLQDLRQDVQQTHQRLHLTEVRLNAIAQTVVNSRFWRWRNRWLKLQQRLGRSVEMGDELLR
jgi:glycosyltransferase involved in cell wall biosynthesis